MSRALVTGASGFIGSHLRQRLVLDGVQVHAISRELRTADDTIWWQADATDGDAVARVVERARPDIIFHLAGYSWGTRDLDAVRPALYANLIGSMNILIEATRRGTPVVLAGSMEEPDAVVDPIPASPYAAAKFATGAYARMLHALHDLSVVVLRLFMVYGPAQMDYGKLLPYVITSYLRGDSPKVSSGKRPVDWIFVEDVVDAFMATAITPGVFTAQSLDVGSGHLVTIRDIVLRTAEFVGGTAPVFGAVPDRPQEVIRVANTRETFEQLAWRPRTSLADGLRQTIDWYRDHVELPAREGGS